MPNNTQKNGTVGTITKPQRNLFNFQLKSQIIFSNQELLLTLNAVSHHNYLI